MRVGIVVREGRSAPAARVRALQFVDAFRDAGLEVQTMAWRATSRGALLADSVTFLRLARWADVLFLQRPNQPAALIDAAGLLGAKLVVDFDDAVWVNENDQPSGRFGERLIHAIGRAAVVTPGSDHLAEWTRSQRDDADIEVVRPACDLAAFPHPHPHPQPALENEPNTNEPAADDAAADGGPPPCAIGWIGSPVNFRDFVPEAVAGLAAVQHEFGARIVIVSSEPADLPGLDTELVPWSVATEGDSLARLDIGIMPLRDGERSRGRCGYKAIQCLGAGLPVVASRVGVAPEIIDDGVTGYTAATEAEWTDALTRLVRDVDLRRRMGAAGRAWVGREADRPVVAQRLVEIFRRAADEEAPARVVRTDRPE